MGALLSEEMRVDDRQAKAADLQYKQPKHIVHVFIALHLEKYQCDLPKHTTDYLTFLIATPSKPNPTYRIKTKLPDKAHRACSELTPASHFSVIFCCFPFPIPSLNSLYASVIKL